MLQDGILWCLGGGALFLLGCYNDSEARKLESVRQIRELRDLVGLLRYECRVVVAVRGRVCSATPINCEMGGLQGVIVEQRAEQYILERIKNMDKDKDKDRDDIWMKTQKVLHSTTQDVPWYLDDGTFRVNVLGAQHASGFYWPAENAVFKGSKKSWPGIETVADLENLPSITKGEKDRKVLGVKRIERVLPVGTCLSVVGEAVKDGNGTISIRAPNGGPFYVSPHTIDQLTGDIWMWASFCYVAAFGFTVYGAVQIAKHSI